jgi:V/A-type H+-transporting ATPase subunit E
MAEHIKDLIQKIQEEGIRAAETKAGQIQHQAQEKADALMAAAEAQAKRMIEDAEAKIKKLEASSRASLEQAARDMILVLRRAIIDMLQGLIHAQIRAALTSEELGKIIAALIKEYGAPEKAGVVVTLSPQDKEKLEGLFFQKLKDHLKQGMTVRASHEMQAGFVISFDAGKSQFDFSDQALVEFICANLKPGIAALLNPKA